MQKKRPALTVGMVLVSLLSPAEANADGLCAAGWSERSESFGTFCDLVIQDTVSSVDGIPGVTDFGVLAVGGGGGGGGGGYESGGGGGQQLPFSYGTTAVDTYLAGGGGGAGEVRFEQISVAPGTGFQIGVGTGGFGGYQNTNGADGAQTTVVSTAGAIIASGGGGGFSGTNGGNGGESGSGDIGGAGYQDLDTGLTAGGGGGGQGVTGEAGSQLQGGNGGDGSAIETGWGFPTAFNETHSVPRDMDAYPSAYTETISFIGLGNGGGGGVVLDYEMANCQEDTPRVLGFSGPEGEGNGVCMYTDGTYDSLALLGQAGSYPGQGGSGGAGDTNDDRDGSDGVHGIVWLTYQVFTNELSVDVDEIGDGEEVQITFDAPSDQMVAAFIDGEFFQSGAVGDFLSEAWAYEDMTICGNTVFEVRVYDYTEGEGTSEPLPSDPFVSSVQVSLDPSSNPACELDMQVPGEASYYPEGVQNEVSIGDVTDAGWTVCYEGTYADEYPLYGEFGILDARCTGDYLMLAGSFDGETFAALAAGPREDVLYDTGTGNEIHIANGVGWYFANYSGWGFVDDEDTLTRSDSATCDVSNNGEPQSLCWNTWGLMGALFPGYLLAGEVPYLDPAGTYRYVLQATSAVHSTEIQPVPYFGPVVTNDPETSGSGSTVTYLGSDLDTVLSATIGGKSATVISKSDAMITLRVPTGLSQGMHDVILQYSTTEHLTLQNGFILQDAMKVWTKLQADNTVKMYAKNIIGEGKIQFFHNGEEIAWIRATDSLNPKLSFANGSHYLVRTRELVDGKNAFEIHLDGTRIWRAAYAG